ncbi:flavin reductase like domain-containing protein [Scheffersomyces xylosifermentans]|uniref:flavin reductase like domain-containing protein n=1 Tax=Scheffersomyces xylosifermentans TaxID=1304137 RepID=UPI00315D1018
MILTAATPNHQELHGMTLSSVCSLAVFPNPLLEFNLHLPSYTSQAIHENRYLAIHLLPPTSKSAFLSRVFASGVKKDKIGSELASTTEELKDGEVFHEMTTPFTRLPKSDYNFHKVDDKISIPILKESEIIFICKLSKTLEVENHEIFVVDVLKIIQNEEYKNSTGGLLYFNRGFHKIGSLVTEAQ